MYFDLFVLLILSYFPLSFALSSCSASCLFLNSPSPPLPLWALPLNHACVVACPVHPSASLNILGPSLPRGLLATGSAEDVPSEEGRPPLSHSYDHPLWAETINPVFSLCSVSLKRIFNSLPIDCWKLNACQSEWVLQSFKKCSVCKTGRLPAQIAPRHFNRERELKYSAGVLEIDDLGVVCVFFMCRILFIDILLLHYLWRLIWRCHCTAGIL